MKRRTMRTNAPRDPDELRSSCAKVESPRVEARCVGTRVRCQEPLAIQPSFLGGTLVVVPQLGDYPLEQEFQANS